jgi:hypothetical protein
MSIGGCGKQIEVFIPKGYHGYLAKRKCGGTGITGYPDLCDECSETFDSQAYRQDVAECGERIEEDD